MKMFTGPCAGMREPSGGEDELYQPVHWIWVTVAGGLI